MAKVLFSNNAATTLAGAITNVATTAALQSGAGALFPNPSGGNYFCMTFVDAATGLLNEIVHVTAVVGDTITMVRGQEGTTALSWLAGDHAANWFTAGTAESFAQIVDVQQQTGNYAVDSSGAANTITVTLSPVPASYASLTGSPLRIKLANTSTSSTVNINANGLGNKSVKMTDGTNPTSGSLIAGSVIEFVYDGTNFQAVAGYNTPVTSGSTTSVVTTTQSVSSVNTRTIYVNTTGVVYTLAQASTLGANFVVTIIAEGGAATITPYASDAINGGSTGASVVCPVGGIYQITTNASGQVYVSSVGFANKNVTQAFVGAQTGTPSTITDSGSPSVNLALANVFTWTLGGNRTMPAPTGNVPGQSGVIWLVQPSSGGPYTMAYNSFWKFAGGVLPTLSTAANAVDVLVYETSPSGSYAACALLKGIA